jgi:HAD superfamily hydrolase (TIGR01490 family)
MSDKLRLAIYDFDDTLYHGDSTVDFWFYLLWRRPYLFLLTPYLLIMGLSRLLRLISFDRMKEAMLSPIRFLRKGELTEMVSDFWELRREHLHSVVVKQLENDKAEGLFMVCITASPEFLVRPMAEYFGFQVFMGTRFKKKNGKIINRMIGQNCKGMEKINRLNAESPFKDREYEVIRFYSDSSSDLPFLELADEPYAIIDGQLYAGIPERWK